MIVAPEWTTLRGIGLGLDHPNPTERKRALGRVLTTIMEALPDVHAVRIFDMAGSILVVRAATDRSDMSTAKLVDYPEHTQLSLENISLWQPEKGQWLCLLTSQDEPIGLFEVLVDDLDDEWITWLELIATQVAGRLALGHDAVATPMPTSVDGSQQAARLVQAVRMLAASDDYDEAAQAALYLADPAVTALAITMFEQPIVAHEGIAEGGAGNHRYVAAFGTRERVRVLDPGVAISAMPGASYIQDLRQEVPIVLEDIGAQDGYLLGWLREQALDHDIQQVISIGMLTAGEVIGTLDLMFSAVRALSADILNLYTVFANQLATTILSKRQLQHSMEAQQFASQLVTTNKSLAIAENYQQMAQAVLNDAPHSVYAVAIALFNRPFTMMGSPVSLRTQAIITRGGDVGEPFVDHFSAQEDARVTYFLQEFLEGRMMLLWSSERQRKPVMAETLTDYLKVRDVEQITAFGLNVRNSLRGLVVFAGDTTLRDPGPQYDGLRVMADQLAAVIENRSLLQQTSDALDLIQSQYAMSSRVFRTNDLSEILQAVFDFAGGRFKNAEMVYTDVLGNTRIVAEVNENGHFNVSRSVSLDSYPAAAALSALEAFEVRNVVEDAFIDEVERIRLLDQGIRALVILPIMMGRQLNGLMMFSTDQETRVAPDRLRAMRSLADQVSVVLQNRNLLQEMELNLSEIQLLYEANRAMLQTQDIMDVLRVLKTNIAPDSAAIVQLGFRYDPGERDQITEIRLDYEITGKGERLLSENLRVDEQTSRNISSFLQSMTDRVMFSPEGTAVPSNPITLIRNRYTIKSYSTLIVEERGQVESLIYLIFDQPNPFQDNTRRLYEAITDQLGITIDNQKMLRESQIAADKLSDQVTALQTISELAVQLNKIQDEQVLLETSASALVHALKVDHSGIVLFNDDMQTGVVVSEYPGRQYLGQTVPVQDNPLLRIDANAPLSPIVIEDVFSSKDLTPNMRELLLNGNIQSIIIAPLVGLNGELIGSVGLDVYESGREFHETEVRTAQTIIAQLAVGLQNIRLFRDTRTRADQLQHISDFSSVTQSTLDLNQLIEKTLSNLPQVIDVSHMTVTLHDDVEDQLVLTGGWTENNTFRTDLETGEIVSINDTTTGYVFETSEYLYIPNMNRNAGLRYPHSRMVATLLAMPLRNQGRTIGVITVGSHRINAYTDTDIAIFQQLANQVAVAMDNAKTYTQSQQIARNKTLANDIAVQLQRQSDIQQMINLTMNKVGKAIGARRGRVRLNVDAQSQSHNTPIPDDRSTE
jgi:GAF domain-containing protein